jgi:hypothetical protein
VKALLERLKRPAPSQRAALPVEPAPVPRPTAEPAAPPPEAEPTSTLLLTWEEAVDLVRSRRGDVFEIQFLGREVERLRESPDGGADGRLAEAAEHLRVVIERKLRAKGLLAPEGRLELVWRGS